MRRKATFILVSALLLGLVAGTAHALLIEPIGAPVAGHSWLQRWDFSIGPETGANRLEFRWKTPSTESFELPIALNLSKPNWTTHAESVTFGCIEGPELKDDHIQFDLVYTPHDFTAPSITHYITAFCDSKPLGCWEVVHHDYQWDCHNYDGDPPSTVPEPASCALLACAIGGIGAMLRKKRRVA